MNHIKELCRAALIAIIGITIFQCGVWHQSQKPAITGKGYEAILRYQEPVRVFVNGVENTPETWQCQLNSLEGFDLGVDGKIGYKSLMAAERVNILEN